MFVCLNASLAHRLEQQTMGDKSTPVTIRMPSGKTLTMTPEVSTPGLWQIKVPATEMGFYSVEQGGKYPREVSGPPRPAPAVIWPRAGQPARRVAVAVPALLRHPCQP